MNAKDVTDAGFQRDVLEAQGPVLVDFWAEWCGPCRAVSPALEQIAGELDGRLKVVKVNVDENPETPSRYGVRGIPSLVLFRDGQPFASQVGAAPKQALRQWIDSQIQPL
jgi:thioredoxin 1